MSSPRELKVDDEIQLRQMSVSDADVTFRLVDDNRKFLRKWLPWVDKTNCVEDSVEAAKAMTIKYEENSVPTYQIIYRGEPCGVAGFNHINEEHKFAAIGYWLAESYNGNGIMTRVCERLTRLAFNDLALNKVEIAANSKNKASRAIPERLGFTKEATLRDRELLADGQFGDLVFYGMLKSEWKESRTT